MNFDEEVDRFYRERLAAAPLLSVSQLCNMSSVPKRVGRGWDAWVRVWGRYLMPERRLLGPVPRGLVWDSMTGVELMAELCCADGFLVDPAWLPKSRADMERLRIDLSASIEVYESPLNRILMEHEITPNDGGRILYAPLVEVCGMIGPAHWEGINVPSINDIDYIRIPKQQHRGSTVPRLEFCKWNEPH